MVPQACVHVGGHARLVEYPAWACVAGLLCGLKADGSDLADLWRVVVGHAVKEEGGVSLGLGCWLFFFSFFFFVPAWCVSARFGRPFPWWAAAPGLVLPALAGWSPCAPLGVLSSVPSGWGFGPPLVVFAGGLVAVVAVGRSLALPPPPPLFLFGGGSACSSLCLPWAGARTGPHSVWSSRLLLAVAFCLAASRPHGSGGLCTRWARRPFLPGYVLALPAGRLRQVASCGSGLGGLGCSCLSSSALPVLTFWVDRHLCCRARCGPVCGPRCQCATCWYGAFRCVRWLVLVSPSG